MRGAKTGVDEHRVEEENGKSDTPAVDAQLEPETFVEEASSSSWSHGKTHLLKRKLDQYRQMAHDATEEAYPDRPVEKLQQKPVFLELFAGEGRLTKTVSERAAVHVPVDVFDAKGYYVGGKADLLLPENQKNIRTLVRQQKGQVAALRAAVQNLFAGKEIRQLGICKDPADH